MYCLVGQQAKCTSGHYHLLNGKCLVWYLHIILINETYLLLSSTLLRVLQP
jgi:hypothetical protein